MWADSKSQIKGVIFEGRRHEDSGHVCMIRIDGVLCVGHGQTPSEARKNAKPWKFTNRNMESVA